MQALDPLSRLLQAADVMKEAFRRRSRPVDLLEPLIDVAASPKPGHRHYCRFNHAHAYYLFWNSNYRGTRFPALVRYFLWARLGDILADDPTCRMQDNVYPVRGCI